LDRDTQLNVTQNKLSSVEEKLDTTENELRDAKEQYIPIISSHPL
jgi:hypothetical protein